MLKLLRAGATVVRRALPSVLLDAAGLVGVASISYGCWLIYPPAGFIATGVQLISAVILIARR